QLAIENYERALGVKPEEVYPRAQIDELKRQLKDQENQELAENAKSKAFAEAMVNGAESAASLNYQQAIASFEKALTIIPEEPTAEMELDRAKQGFEEQKKNERLDLDFAKAMETGNQAFGVEDYQNAEIAFATAVDLKKGNADAIAKLTETRRILGEIKKRAEEQKKLNIAFQELVLKADDLVAQESYSMAISTYDQALQLIPGDQQATEKKQLAQGLLDKQSSYAEAIRDGDAAFANQEWDRAESAYRQANQTQPSESYPTNQLALIGERRAEDEALNAQYKDLIQQADFAFEQKNWDNAKSLYTNASNLKSNEVYPKGQIEKILSIQADQLALQSAYNQAMEVGRVNLEKGSFDQAIVGFQQALDLVPGDQVATEQLELVNRRKSEALAQQEVQGQFDAKMVEAREFESTSKWIDAEVRYQEALQIIPEQAEALKKLEFVRSQINEIEKREEAYRTLLSGGDESFNAGKYQESIIAYQAALEIKPGEVYPGQQIALANQKLEEQKSVEERDSKYAELITKADGYFTERDWKNATLFYTEALVLKENETYPGIQLDKINVEKAQEMALRQQVREYIDGGKVKVGAKQYAEAIADFKLALDLVPNNTEIPTLISDAESKMAEQQEAQAKEQKYNDIVARGETELSAEQYETALATFKEALVEKPGDAYSEGRVRDIELRMTELAEIEKNYRAAMNEAQMAMGVQNFDGAEAAYNKALVVRENDEEAKKGIAAVALARQAAIKIEADKVMFRDLMGQAAAQEAGENFDLAMDLYAQAQSIFPENPNPGNKIESIKALLAEKETNQKNFDGFVQQGEFALTQGQFAESITQFDKALTIFPNNPLVKDKKEEATRLLAEQKAQEVLNAEYAQFIASGDQNLNNGDWDASIRDFEKAQSLKPGESYPLDQLNRAKEQKRLEQEALLRAEEFYQNGEKFETEFEFGSAVASFENAVKVRPNDAKYQDRLAIAKQKQAEWEEKRKNAERKTTSFGDVSFYEGDETDLEKELADQEAKKRELAERNKALQDSSLNREIVEADLSGEVDQMANERRKEEMARLEENRKKIQQRAVESNKTVYHTKPVTSGYRSELAKEYPQGITEEIIDELNRKVIKRVVVKGDEGDEYLKIVAKWGTYFFKNGKSINTDLWTLEAF
ncbi:MAG: tetratricopeptide (TPR) repeat protein, partial [Luteibaculaceae bacterium]